jgi:hypothetical protein
VGADLVVSLAAMTSSTLRLSSLAAVLASSLVACGGSQHTGTGTGTGSGSAVTPTAAGDLDLVIEARPIAGRVLAPDANMIPKPGLAKVSPKKKLTLDKHRAEFVAAKPDELEVKGQVLATRLVDEVKVENDKGNVDGVKALLGEAFATLKTVREKTAGKTDVTTLRMLGFHALNQPDMPTAESVYEELNTRFASDPAAFEFQLYLGWSRLRQGKHAAALSSLALYALADRLAPTTPEAKALEAYTAFVAAWARWGAGGTGAFDAIRAAYLGWTTPESKPAVEGDFILIAARAGTPSATAIEALRQGSAPEALAKNLIGLSNAYAAAGHFAEAAAVIDQAAGAAGIDPGDVAKLRFTQAQYIMRLGQPAETAAATDAAYKAAPTAQAKVELATGALGLAKLFHTIYSTALDEAYYPAAKALYLGVAVNGDAAQKTEAENLTGQLDQTKSNSKAGTGKHQIEVIGPLVAMRELDLVACYEASLLAAPTLAGTLELKLDVAATGAIEGATTSPPGGQEGLAAVASCVEARARGWKLPARTMPGRTAITATYTLAPK